MRLQHAAGAVAVLGVAVVLAGCSGKVVGTAQPAPGVTVTVPGTVVAPSATPTTVAPTPVAPRPTTGSPVGPAAATPIPVNGNGYTFVQTHSGKAQCQVSVGAVGCQVLFQQPGPRTDSGNPADGVNVTSGGEITYIEGNLGDPPYYTMEYTTYTSMGWTIQATLDGTRFTNDATGHGMYVNISGVQSF
ncbi:hypothetical protein [Tsukamurella soli]|uniref:Lipoprotein LpqJ n=1 Tax=Tsukamurella soli TaxID=644556 RepID=A0ABP8K7B7_9ACTN